MIEALQQKGLPFGAVTRTTALFGVPTVHADLLQPAEAIRAIQGATHVYLCVGLPYESKVWAKDWPILMQNVITACEQADALLVFLDNAYLYGPAPLTFPFKETHPQHPTTQKGKARKQTTDLLLQAIKEKRIRAVIGRSADFYGKKAINSPLYISFLENMLQGKAPQVLSDRAVLHTYAYSGDNGRALVELALDERTHGQVWHLPVGAPVTLLQINTWLNDILSTNFELGYLPKFIRRLLGLVVRPLAEVEEMLYQFEVPYQMNFEKFQRHFPDFKVTPYPIGLTAMVASFSTKEK